MSHKPPYVYVSYIKTTPNELWEALTSSRFIEQYWFGHTLECDWKIGSTLKFITTEKDVMVQGKVLVFDKPKKLAYSWSTQKSEEDRKEKPSRVTFLIEQAGEAVRLTVRHDEFEENSVAYPRIQMGWPIVISGLKELT